MDIKLTMIEDGERYKWTTEGQKIEGLLQAYKVIPTPKGEGNVYEVKTATGLVAFFAPSMLHGKLQNVPIGNLVSIEYTGEKKTNSGNTMKCYNVGHVAVTPANLKAFGIVLTEEVKDLGPRFDK